MILDNPRQIAQDAIKASVAKDIWDRNAEFVRKLREEVNSHPVTRHPAIKALSEGRFDKETLKTVHLEYRHAIVQVFTDALLMAQATSRQLEDRVGLAPGTKMQARFLLTLNDLDEFGFKPGTDKNGYYKGNPLLAHYPLFEALMDDYGIPQEVRQKYQPSDIARKTRDCLESSFDDFLLVTTLLAVGELEVVLFSPPLRKATEKVGLRTDQGYYFVHGTTEEQEVEAADDDHEADLWYLVTQGLTPDRYEDVRNKAIEYSDVWYKFWDHQMSLLDNKATAAAS